MESRLEYVSVPLAHDIAAGVDPKQVCCRSARKVYLRKVTVFPNETVAL